jgi:malate dehydrogenase (oxaloacetate-decarboxylating)(NADP+)
VIDVNAPSGAFGLSIAIAQGQTVFLADTAVNVAPSPERMAEIAVRAAAWAQRLGHEPRVAMLSFASFGQPQRDHAERIRVALRFLDQKNVKFEYDGEMTADIALNYALMKKHYPFCRLTGPANILIMPNLQAAHIAAKLLGNIGSVNLIGPIMDGFDKPAQILRLGSTVSDIVTSAVLAAYQAGKPEG